MYFEYLLAEIPKHMEDKDNTFLENPLPGLDKLSKNIKKPEQ